MIQDIVSAMLQPEPSGEIEPFRMADRLARSGTDSDATLPTALGEPTLGVAGNGAASLAGAVIPPTVWPPDPTGAVAERVAQVLRGTLGKARGIRVDTIYHQLDVPRQQALWRAHRRKLLADGDVGLAGRAARLLRSLDVKRAHPVAVIAIAQGEPVLLWIDLSAQEIVAAFAHFEQWVEPSMLSSAVA